jgi:hypothetical protein
MNVYEHRFSALTLPGQGELWNKEHSEPPLFRPSQPGKGQHEDLMLAPPEHCRQWREYAPLWSSLPWPDPCFSLPSKQIPEEPVFKRFQGQSGSISRLAHLAAERNALKEPQ